MKQIFKANFDGGQNIRGVSFSSIEKYALLYKIKGVYFPFDIFLEIYTPTEHWGWIFPQSARKCTPNKNSANFRKPSRPALSLLQLCKRSSSPEVSSTPYRVPHHLTRTHHWIKVNGLINCFDCQIKEITLEPGVPSSQKGGQRGKSPWKKCWLHKTFFSYLSMWDVRFSTLNMKERRMWSLPSRSLRVARSVASRESGSTLDIFTFHSYNESFTSSTWNNQPTRPWFQDSKRKYRQFFSNWFLYFSWVYWVTW